MPFISFKFPVSNNLNYFFFFSKFLSVPKILPITGMKNKAITRDEESMAKSVTGKKNINSPAIPGQKINGKKLLVLWRWKLILE